MGEFNENFDDDKMKDLFSDEELYFMKNFMPISKHLPELKQRGIVSEIRSVKDGMVIEVTEYTSLDGSHHFTEIKSFLEANEQYEKVQEINFLIDEAIDAEEYEKAAELKKQKDELLNKEQ